MRLLEVLLVAGMLFAACGKSDSSSDKGKDKDDDGATAGDDTGGFDPSDPNGGYCKAVVAETFPEQVTMTCTLPDGSTLTSFKLDARPDPATLRVLLNGTEVAKGGYTYDADGLTVTLSDDFSERNVQILYTKAS